MNYRKYLLMPLAAVMLAAGAAVLTLQTVKAGEQKPAEGDIVLRLDRENRDGMPAHFRTSGDAFGTVSSQDTSPDESGLYTVKKRYGGPAYFRERTAFGKRMDQPGAVSAQPSYRTCL